MKMRRRPGVLGAVSSWSLAEEEESNSAWPKIARCSSQRKVKVQPLRVQESHCGRRGYGYRSTLAIRRGLSVSQRWQDTFMRRPWLQASQSTGAVMCVWGKLEACCS